jgi:hypothetical protein
MSDPSLATRRSGASRLTLAVWTIVFQVVIGATALGTCTLGIVMAVNLVDGSRSSRPELYG